MADDTQASDFLSVQPDQRLSLTSSAQLEETKQPQYDEDEKFDTDTDDSHPAQPADDEDDDADEEDEAADAELSDVETAVDLGYIAPPSHPLRLTRAYFPSKVGGRPAWLNPQHIPTASQLTCAHCGDVMDFLLQLSAPIRAAEPTFHRTLFLFVCHRQSCLARHSYSQPTVLCYRSQLPRRNAYYSYDPPPKLKSAGGCKAEVSVENECGGNALCAVCGVKGASVCSACKSVWYCGKRCQKRDWKHGHKQLCNQTDSTPSASPAPATPPPVLVDRSSLLFPCHELEIETEYIPASSTADYSKENELLTTYNTKQTDGDADEDDELDDTDGLSSLGPLHKHDRLFTRFRRRIAHNPDQVLRYERAGTELWVSSDAANRESGGGSGGVCERCGGVRVYECQVLPQLLYYLDREESGVRRVGEDEKAAAMRALKEGLDWGSLFVYTCERNCGDGEAEYMREWVYVQQHSGQYAQLQEPLQ